MSKQKEIILSGVGGQGLIVCGTLLGEAAVLFDGKKATLASEYGVETRGTFAKSDVVVSEQEIFYPEAVTPNLILCLAQVAYQRYQDFALEEEAVLVYDSDQVQAKEGAANHIGFPILTMARELGNPATANIIAMGIVAKKTGIVTPDAAKKAIQRFFASRSQKVVDLNYKAFDAGYAL